MTKLLEFLIVQLKTVDGLRGTGKAIVKAQLEFKRAQAEQKLKKSKLELTKKAGLMMICPFWTQYHEAWKNKTDSIEVFSALKTIEICGTLDTGIKSVWKSPGKILNQAL